MIRLHSCRALVVLGCLSVVSGRAQSQDQKDAAPLASPQQTESMLPTEYDAKQFEAADSAPAEGGLRRLSRGDARTDAGAGLSLVAQPGSGRLAGPLGTLEPIEEPSELVQFAPPSNDSCLTPQSISGTGTWGFVNTEATRDGASHASCNFFGQQQIARDVWFLWTASATASFTVDTCSGTPLDTKMAVYPAPTNPTACPTATPLNCNDDACSVQSRITFSATQGAKYLIRVGVVPTTTDGQGGVGGSGTLTISFQGGQVVCSQPPANCQAPARTDAFLSNASSRVADDFTAGATGTITQVCFYGVYYDNGGNCQGVSPDDIDISYFRNSFGRPSGSAIGSFDKSEYTIVGPVATGNLISGLFPEYAYVVTHPPVSVTSGTCYWLEIRNNLPTAGTCGWYWVSGAGGNGFFTLNTTNLFAGDLAFCTNLPKGNCPPQPAPAEDQCATPRTISCNQTYIAETTFATTSPSDPAFTCRFGGAAQGVGTVWFRYTPSAGFPSVRFSLCDNPDGDTMIAVYRANDCGSLVQVACNDDFCGLRSQVCVSNLTANATYYIQVGVRNESDLANYSLQVSCNCNAPANDLCTGATQLTFNAQGTATLTSQSTDNASIDTRAPGCDGTILTGPSLWYRVTGTGTQITATTCNSADFDTKITVYCGTCTDLFCIGTNDDGLCNNNPSLRSTISWCSEVGRTYYLMVHGFDGAVGTFTISATRAATSCTGAPLCVPCTNTACPPGAIAEVETCSQNINEGCNGSPVALQPLQCGQTVCGTLDGQGSFRDTDWYSFSVAVRSRVTWSVTAEMGVEAILLNDQCNPDLVVLGSSQTDRCGTATLTRVLEPGNYRAFVAQFPDTYQCPGAGQMPYNDYFGTLTCVPIGACCATSDCTQRSQAECAAASGQYGGDGTNCPINYVVTTCASAFEDIRTTGTRLTLTGDVGQIVEMGFTFRFYGVESAQIGVTANGYLTFGTVYNSLLNSDLPSSTLPHAVIAPLWDDLAPEAGGTIHVRTDGTAPNRRFIAQWSNVPRFQAGDSNTFQAVLYEQDRCIEFRYGAFTPQPVAGDYTVGVENHDGSRGTQIDAATIASGQCRRLCPQVAMAGCTGLTPCIGDANRDRRVNFDDMTTVLANFGDPGPIGDANLDGRVNFDDMTTVLANFGFACP